jgi:hypothetical protein
LLLLLLLPFSIRRLFFPAGAEEIIVNRPGGSDQVPSSRIAHADFHWEFLSKLIARYERIAKDRQELPAELRAAGVPIQLLDCSK